MLLVNRLPRGKGRAFGNFALKNQTNVKFSNTLISNYSMKRVGPTSKHLRHKTNFLK